MNDKLQALRTSLPDLPEPFRAAVADRLNNSLAVILAALDYAREYWTPRSGDADQAFDDAAAAALELNEAIALITQPKAKLPFDQVLVLYRGIFEPPSYLSLDERSALRTLWVEQLQLAGWTEGEWVEQWNLRGM